MIGQLSNCSCGGWCYWCHWGHCYNLSSFKSSDKSPGELTPRLSMNSIIAAATVCTLGLPVNFWKHTTSWCLTHLQCVQISHSWLPSFLVWTAGPQPKYLPFIWRIYSSWVCVTSTSIATGSMAGEMNGILETGVEVRAVPVATPARLFSLSLSAFCWRIRTSILMATKTRSSKVVVGHSVWTPIYQQIMKWEPAKANTH